MKTLLYIISFFFSSSMCIAQSDNLNFSNPDFFAIPNWGRISSYVVYSSDSSIESIMFRNGKLETSIVFYPNKLKREMVTEYKGEIVGALIDWYENGNIASVEMYNMDTFKLEDLDSLETRLIDNEETNEPQDSIYNFVKTETVKIGLNGTSYYFYEDGTLHYEINYKHHIRDGAFKIYNREGVLSKEFLYDNGRVVKGIDYN